ncbi:aldo/keto reductase [Flindersiella endophytica]
MRTERGWHLDERAAEPIVRRAVEEGMTFFDTADMYDRGATEEVTAVRQGTRPNTTAAKRHPAVTGTRQRRPLRCPGGQRL